MYMVGSELGFEAHIGLLLFVLAGIANCFIGAVLMHDLRNAALVAWLTPICVFLGVLALAGLVLEVPKRMVSERTSK